VSVVSDKVTSSACYFSWEEPTVYGILQNYKIYIKFDRFSHTHVDFCSSAYEKEFESTLMADVREYNYRSAIASAEYIAQVQANNSDNLGLFSVPVYCNTLTSKLALSFSNQNFIVTFICSRIRSSEKLCSHKDSPTG